MECWLVGLTADIRGIDVEISIKPQTNKQTNKQIKTNNKIRSAIFILYFW